MPGVAMEALPTNQFYGSGHNVGQFSRLNHVHSGTSYDVTDNKTSEANTTVPIFNLNRMYTMNDSFHREDERLKTFETWPLAWMDKYELAQSGMFYTGDYDKVKCYFCEVEIGRWEHTDQPVPEHLRWSPNCPLLRRRTTNNVPINPEALDRLLPPVSYDVCGANDSNIDLRPAAYTEGSYSRQRSTAMNTGGLNGGSNVGAPSCSSGIPYYPDYPEYAIESARVRSFAEWPRNMKQKPEQLAEAGFFYTGVGDRVKCFSCGGGLKDWDDNDDPWEQHALWLSKCRYLKLIKGQMFIDSVATKQKTKEEDEAEVVVPPATVAKPVELSATSLEMTPKPNGLAATTTAMPLMVDSLHQTVAQRIVKAAEQALEVPAAAAEKKPPTSIPEEKLCKICYAGEYNTAFLPCGHVVACAKCASSVTKCPLCRKPFTDVMRVYFS